MWSLILTLYNVKMSRLLYLRCLARVELGRWAVRGSALPPRIYAHSLSPHPHPLSLTSTTQGSLISRQPNSRSPTITDQTDGGRRGVRLRLVRAPRCGSGGIGHCADEIESVSRETCLYVHENENLRCFLVLLYYHLSVSATCGPCAARQTLHTSRLYLP